MFESVKEMEEVNLFSEAAKLTKTEFRLVREIVAEGEKGRDIISSELARRLGVTRSAISQIVNKLEARGVVKRVPSSTDRKTAYIRLSERTVSVFEEQCREANAVMEYVLHDLGEKRVQALIAAYDGFAASLKRARALSHRG